MVLQAAMLNAKAVKPIRRPPFLRSTASAGCAVVAMFATAAELKVMFF
jgi:hypothetical protein